MVQTELDIGSNLKPHCQETWQMNNIIKNTYMSYGEEWPFTSSHHSISSPGRGSNLYWSPENPSPYDTFLIYNGERVSIQDDCGIYPTMMIYPQDGSKYRLDITGNITASVDVTPTNPHSIHYEDATSDSEWDVEWSMTQEYDMTINAVRKKPASSFYIYTIYMQQNGETITETTIDSRTSVFDYLNNGTLIASYNPATDVLCGYDSSGNIDFQAALIPTGYYSGTGNDHRLYYGAFTTTNLAGKMISVKRYGMNVYINLHNATDTWGSRTYVACDGDYGSHTDYIDTNTSVRAHDWGANLVEAGVLPYAVTSLQGYAGGYNFDAVTYRETAGSARKLIVFDMQYNPEGTEVTIGGVSARFRMLSGSGSIPINIQCWVNTQEDEEIVVDTDSDTDTDDDIY